MNKKVIFGILMGIAAFGTGVGVFVMVRKKNEPKVQTVGEVGEVVSDKLPVKDIVSQKIVKEAIVTKTVGGNTIVERTLHKPVVISTPVKPMQKYIPKYTKPFMLDKIDPLRDRMLRMAFV